jgi:hypothetical protein
VNHIHGISATARNAFELGQSGRFTGAQICDRARAERDARNAMKTSRLALLRMLGDAAASGSRAERQGIAACAAASGRRFDQAIVDDLSDEAAQRIVESRR